MASKAIKKNKKIKKPWIIVIIIITFVLLGLAFNKKIDKKSDKILLSGPTTIVTTATPFISQPYMYHSDFLKFSIIVPAGFEVDDEHKDTGTIVLKSKEGKIHIGRGFTNNDNAEGYFYGLQRRGLLTIIDRKDITIEEQKVIVLTTHLKNKEERFYLFYPEKGTIFNFNTDLSSLYDELDQVAQSFKYEK